MFLNINSWANYITQPSQIWDFLRTFQNRDNIKTKLGFSIMGIIHKQNWDLKNECERTQRERGGVRLTLVECYLSPFTRCQWHLPLPRATLSSRPLTLLCALEYLDSRGKPGSIVGTPRLSAKRVSVDFSELKNTYE